MRRLAEVSFETRGGVVVAHVAGEVDMSNVTELRRALEQSVTNEALALVMDLADLRYIDSAGIHLVYELREHLKNRGQQIRLVVPAGSTVADALDLANVRSVVGSAETTESAVRELDSSG
jgi:anti-sigma B factor antagonist